MRNIVHIIVSPCGLHIGDIKYRRQRFAEYLVMKEDTKKVFWVHACGGSIRDPINLLKSIRKISKESPAINDSSIAEFAIPSFSPLTFSRGSRILAEAYLSEFKLAVKGLNSPKILWFTVPIFPFMLKADKWNAIIYDCSDLWSESMRDGTDNPVYSMIKGRLVKKAESRIINSSNIIFATSEYLAEIIRSGTRREAIVVENGVEFERFSNYGSYQGQHIFNEIPRPRLGFIGGMKFKIDFSLLESMAREEPEWSIVLIGPRSPRGSGGLDRLLKYRNVYWMGPAKPEEIPGYLEHLDIGMLPYKEIEYNKAVFPLKLFEYLAKGLPVVGCGLPSTKRYSADRIYLHVDRGCFINACREAISWRGGDNARDIEARVDLARKASWENKFQIMYQKAKQEAGLI